MNHDKTEYNKNYWLAVKSDPDRLAKYKARRNRNQNARRLRQKSIPSAVEAT